MSASNVLENALLSLIFENANSGLNIGDATGLRGSTTAGNAYIGLHTADPGEAGSQTTNETTYTGYSTQGRATVARSSAGWTVTAGVADNDAAIGFSQCTAGSASITHVSIGSNLTTAGDLWFSGTATLSVSAGITPQFAIGALDISLD
jgi:hypothetical protein